MCSVSLYFGYFFQNNKMFIYLFIYLKKFGCFASLKCSMMNWALRSKTSLDRHSVESRKIVSFLWWMDCKFVSDMSDPALHCDFTNFGLIASSSSSNRFWSSELRFLSIGRASRFGLAWKTEKTDLFFFSDLFVDFQVVSEDIFQ